MYVPTSTSLSFICFFDLKSNIKARLFISLLTSQVYFFLYNLSKAIIQQDSTNTHTTLIQPSGPGLI